MKLPEDRICPNHWPNCEECKYDRSCKPGHYHIETDLEVVIRAAEVSEKVVNVEVVESVEKCRGTWFDGFSKMSREERWKDYRKYHVADLVSKDPVKCMSGPTAPGGGGAMKVKKSKKGNKPTVYVWGENP